jgi:alkaline phosphatase D
MKVVQVQLYFCFFILCLPGFLSHATARDSGIIPPPDSFTQTTISSIAFGSCAKHWQPQPIWDAVIAHNPDLWLFLGDNIYADTDGRTAWQVTKEQLAGEWNRLADKPEFRRARAQIPMMATWDNHDYGTHTGGGDFHLKEVSKNVFLNFWNELEDSPRWKHSGIYTAKIFGPEGKRLQIILLDTKFNRSVFKKDPTSREQRLISGKVGGFLPDGDPAKTYLGEQQWNWLEEQLHKPAEIRLIASSTQVIPNEKGMDEWGNFPHERQKLFDLIDETGASGVILLSGNVHFGELSRYSGGDYPLYELTSSGMTHVNESYARATNQHRVVGPVIRKNFGLIEIHWEASIVPMVSLKVIDEAGETVFSHDISLTSLK